MCAENLIALAGSPLVQGLAPPLISLIGNALSPKNAPGPMQTSPNSYNPNAGGNYSPNYNMNNLGGDYNTPQQRRSPDPCRTNRTYDSEKTKSKSRKNSCRQKRSTSIEEYPLVDEYSEYMQCEREQGVYNSPNTAQTGMSTTAKCAVAAAGAAVLLGGIAYMNSGGRQSSPNQNSPQNSRWRTDRCTICNKDLYTRPTITLECKHSVHSECIYVCYKYITTIRERLVCPVSECKNIISEGYLKAISDSSQGVIGFKYQ